MKETELAKYFIEYLQDFDLYFEVSCFGSFADIVAVKPPLKIAFEVKMSFGLAVLEQAIRNKDFYHYSYVAVPKLKHRSGLIFRLCKNFGIGVLECDCKYGSVEEIIHPQINRKALSKHIQLLDYQKKGEAGCVYGRPSPFKEMVANITEYLHEHNGATFKEVFETSYITYRTLSAFKAGVYQWTRKGVIKEFYVEKGKLYLCKVKTKLNFIRTK